MQYIKFLFKIVIPYLFLKLLHKLTLFEISTKAVFSIGMLSTDSDKYLFGDNGNEDGLAWRNSLDMKNFAKETAGHMCLAGYNTAMNLDIKNHKNRRWLIGATRPINFRAWKPKNKEMKWEAIFLDSVFSKSAFNMFKQGRLRISPSKMAFIGGAKFISNYAVAISNQRSVITFYDATDLEVKDPVYIDKGKVISYIKNHKGNNSKFYYKDLETTEYTTEDDSFIVARGNNHGAYQSVGPFLTYVVGD